LSLADNGLSLITLASCRIPMTTA